MTIERHEIEAFLRTLPRVSTWPERDIRWLANNVVVAYLAEGDPVFALTQESDDAFIVYSGQVRQYIEDRTGKELWFRTCTSGAALIQERLFRGQGHATQAIAEAPSTLLQIHAWTLNELLTRHPELWDLLSSSTVFRLQGIPILRFLDDNQIEILASTVRVREFKPGETICSREEEDGNLWIIDWGQVRITDHGAIGLDPAGRLTVHDDQEPDAPRRSVLTAGSYFVGGQLGVWNLPYLTTVTAVAETRAKLLMIEGNVVKRMFSGIEDVRNFLQMPPDLRGWLKTVLGADELFSDLRAEHWDDLAGITGWEHVPAGLDVVRQGQHGTKLYLLAVGTSHVYARDASGRDLPEYLLPTTKGSNYFGINALLSGDRYQATVRSTQSPLTGETTLDGSDWLTIQRDDLEYLIRSNLSRWRATRLGTTLLKGPIGKEYPWLKQDEDVILVERRHSIWLWLRVAVAFLIAYGVVGLLAVADTLLTTDFGVFAYAMALLAPLLLLLTWYIIDYFNDYYVVTTQRIVRRDQVFLISENRVDAMMERVQDTVVNTKLIGKIFNFGDLNISTAATGGVIRFEMIPRPNQVQETISGLQEKRKAFLQAEERENLRHMMLQKLNIRIIPAFPPRALPEGTVVPVQKGAVASAFDLILSPVRRFLHWLRRFPENAYIWLVSLMSKSAGQEIRKERADKRKRTGEQEPDTVVYRKHIWFLISSSAIPLITLAVSVLVILIPGRALLESGLPGWVIALAVLWVLGCLFWFWFRYENWRNDKYILTKFHIIDIYALPLGIREEVKQAEWSKVQNASFVIPSFWANLLKFGTVTVETASTFGNFDFIHVPNPAAVQQEVFLRMEIARQASEAKTKATLQSVQLEALELYHTYQTDRPVGEST